MGVKAVDNLTKTSELKFEMVCYCTKKSEETLKVLTFEVVGHKKRGKTKSRWKKKVKKILRKSVYRKKTLAINQHGLQR